jgi:hypothetical protein
MGDVHTQQLLTSMIPRTPNPSTRSHWIRVASLFTFAYLKYLWWRTVHQPHADMVITSLHCKVQSIGHLHTQQQTLTGEVTIT